MIRSFQNPPITAIVYLKLIIMNNYLTDIIGYCFNKYVYNDYICTYSLSNGHKTDTQT